MQNQQNQWYIFSNNQTYGPFVFEQLQDMVKTGQILPDTLLFSSMGNTWTPASQIKGIFPGRYRKKKKGCLTFLAAAFFIIVLILASLIVYSNYKNSQRLITGKPVTVHSQTINGSGMVKIRNTGSKIDGMTIEVPEGSYGKPVNFTISVSNVQKHTFGEDFNPITPLIEVNNGGNFSVETMLVTIPISVAEDEFAMAFYYTNDRKLEPLPFICQDESKLITATNHFSQIIVSKTKKFKLDGVDISSGFRPGVDDWNFINRGSEIVPRGHCAGQTASMAYYYGNRRANGALPLFSAFDNNNLPNSTPAFWMDDSMGYRLCSMVQKNADFTGSYFKNLVELYHRKQVASNKDIYRSFVYSLQLYKLPVQMGIYVRSGQGDNVKLQSGHAILVYRATGNSLYIADPNYPGQEKTLSFDGVNFGTYVTTDNAGNPKKTYNSFSLVGMSALYKWNLVREYFNEIDKDAHVSSIGDNAFTATNYYIMTDYKNGKPVYAKNPSEVSLKREQMERIREAYKDSDQIPADWMNRDYVIGRFGMKASGAHALLFRGDKVYAGSGNTKLKASLSGDSPSVLFIPVEEGVNDLGILFYRVMNSSKKFVDFIRVPVLFGETDIEGKWIGNAQVTDISRGKPILRIIMKVILGAIDAFISDLFGDEPATDAELNKRVEESLNQTSFDPINLEVDISKSEKPFYKITYRLFNKDSEMIYEGVDKVTYKAGRLKFQIDAQPDAEIAYNMVFDLRLQDNYNFSGDMNLKAFGIGGFIRGTCELDKVNNVLTNPDESILNLK